MSPEMKTIAIEHVREMFREPIKNCQTCAHRAHDDMGKEFDRCRRFQRFCSIANHRCAPDLREWRAKPPMPPKHRRRSLRRWLIDLLWA
jgi:hypothetical protein